MQGSKDEIIENLAKALFNCDRKKNEWDEEHEKSKAEREKREQAYKALASEDNENKSIYYAYWLW
jgi:hypothetical protein